MVPAEWGGAGADFLSYVLALKRWPPPTAPSRPS